MIFRSKSVGESTEYAIVGVVNKATPAILAIMVALDILANKRIFIIFIFLPFETVLTVPF